MTAILGYQGERRPHRRTVAVVAMSLGFLVGLVGGVLIRSVRTLESRDTAPAWIRSELQCIGSESIEGGRAYFVKNIGKQDYQWPAPGNWLLMVDTGKGLARAPEGLTVTAPQFIPAGDVGVVTVTGDYVGIPTTSANVSGIPETSDLAQIYAKSGLVLFDLRRHERLALR